MTYKTGTVLYSPAKPYDKLGIVIKAFGSLRETVWGGDGHMIFSIYFVESMIKAGNWVAYEI